MKTSFPGAWLRLAFVLSGLLLWSTGCGGGGDAQAPTLKEQYEQTLQLPPEVRGPRLIAIATQQLANNNEIGADKTLEAAEQSAEAVGDPYFRADAYLKIFALRVRTGQAEIYRDLLKEALKAAEKIERVEQKYDTLLQVAEAYARDLDKSSSASLRLADAEALLPQLSEDQQLGARIRLARTLAVTGDAERSQAMLDESLKQAGELPDARNRIEAWGEAAATLIRLERTDEADPLLSQATAAAGEMEDAEARSHAYLSLARKMMLTSQDARAGSLLRQASSAAEEIGDPTMRSSVMDEISATRRLLEE